MAFEYTYEVFSKIDKEEDEEKKLALLKEYGAKLPFNMLLSLNFNDNRRLAVPEGVPPYKRDEAMHPDGFPTSLAQQIKRLTSIVKGRSENIPKVQREYIFIQVLEAVPPKEADDLVFCKDKALEELYPTITAELVAKVFPEYVVKNDTKQSAEV